MTCLNFEDNAFNNIIYEKNNSENYNYAMLPIARLAKTYSGLLNVFGKVGPVPEGMSPVVALRATWLADEHGRRKKALKAAVKGFEEEHGRPPAYWELVELARPSADT